MGQKEILSICRYCTTFKTINILVWRKKPASDDRKAADAGFFFPAKPRRFLRRISKYTRFPHFSTSGQLIKLVKLGS